MNDKSERERRRSRRARVKQKLRVRPSTLKDGAFEEFGTTVNLSQHGVYFETNREIYRKGMQLIVTVPYHSPLSRQNYEYLGEVARVEQLTSGQRGVAVRFLPSTKKSRNSQKLEFVR